MNLKKLTELNNVLQAALQSGELDEIDESISKMRFEIWEIRQREMKRKLAMIAMQVYSQAGFVPTADSATVRNLNA